MPDLIIYVPFQRAANSDIKEILQPLTSAAPPQQRPLSGGPFGNVEVVFLGEENGQVGAGDTLLVNAHGGPGNPILGDNTGAGDIAPAQLWVGMNNLNANQAATVIFYCCFSALPGHVAWQYKTSHPLQNVYGSEVACTGGDLFAHSGGRSNRPITIRTAVWENPGGTLTQM